MKVGVEGIIIDAIGCTPVDDVDNGFVGVDVDDDVVIGAVVVVVESVGSLLLVGGAVAVVLDSVATSSL